MNDIKNQTQAFILLGKAAKELQNGEGVNQETIRGLYRAMAKLVRDSHELELHLREQSEQYNDLVTSLLTTY